MTPGCRPGFCGLPPLHISGANFCCVGSCVVTHVYNYKCRYGLLVKEVTLCEYVCLAGTGTML